MNKGLQTQTEDPNNELLSFDWEGSETENFFGVEPETPSIVPTQVEPEEEEPEEEEEFEVYEEEEEEKELEQFFDAKDEEEYEETEEEYESSGDPGSIYSDVYKDLREHGIFKHVELEEGEDLDAEKFLELQEEEYETEISERLQAWASEELDEDAKSFIKFKREGGNTEDFFELLKTKSGLPEGDLADEKYQDEVIRYQLAKEGWDADEIEDRLEYLTEAGRKDRAAVKYEEKIEKERVKEKQKLLNQAQERKQFDKQQEETFKASIKSSLEEVDEVNGFSIPQRDKNKIYNFLTKKEHKISDSRSITGFQKKLAEVFQDTEKMILLAKLVESDFDMSDFEKKVITKKTRKVKSNLEQRKGLRSNNSGSSLEGGSLADLFN